MVAAGVFAAGAALSAIVGLIVLVSRIGHVVAADGHRSTGRVFLWALAVFVFCTLGVVVSLAITGHAQYPNG
jgi:hypothetical protein